MTQGGVCIVVACLMLTSAPMGAQTAIKADGVIESSSGGFRFPDGSIQSSAMSSSLAPVRDTGQESCWDTDGNPISCINTGQDGDLQAGVAWPTPRFTDNGDGTVSDNLTGLSWLKDAGCFGHDVTWANAFTEIDSLNAGTDKFCPEYSAGTFDDWRVPNILELVSLLDFGTAHGQPQGPFLFSGVGLCTFWASTTVASSPAYTWQVVFGPSTSQITISSTLKSGDFCLWPVRGGQ